MKRKFAIVVIVILISSLTVMTVFAFPGTPFLGQGTAKGIQVNLAVVGATTNIEVASQRANISGDTGVPVETNGRSEGVNVQVISGSLPGVNANLINALTTKIFDGNPAIVSNSAAMPFIDSSMSPLATTGSIAGSSNSRVTSLVGWSSAAGSAASVNVLDGIGGQTIVSALDISNQSISETTPDHILFSNGSSILSGVSVQMPYLTGTVGILTADVITATADTSSDGTLPNASAVSAIEFSNLAIAGTPIPSPTAGEVYTVTSGAVPVDVARITIMPILTSNFNATNSSAQSVSLYIEFLAGPLVGTDIYLGQTSAESSAIDNPSGPTAITTNHISTNTGNPATIVVAFSLVGIFTTMTAIVLLQRKKVFIKQQK